MLVGHILILSVVVSEHLTPASAVQAVKMEEAAGIAEEVSQGVENNSSAQARKRYTFSYLAKYRYTRTRAGPMQWLLS